EHRHLDGREGGALVARKGWVKVRGSSARRGGGSIAHVVRLPGAHLQDQVVGVRTGYEVVPHLIDALFKRRTTLGALTPEFLSPPLLRIEPACPDNGEGLKAFGRRNGVVAVREGSVSGESGNLAFETDYAVSIRLGGATGGNDAIHIAGVANGPLECLLRAHGEADDRLQVLDVEFFGEHLMDSIDVVANGKDRKARAVEGLRCIRRRRTAAVAKELGSDEKEPAGIQCAGRILGGLHEPFVAAKVGHVMRGQKDGVVAGCVQLTVGAIDEMNLRQDGPRFRVEVVQDVLVTLWRKGWFHFLCGKGRGEND